MIDVKFGERFTEKMENAGISYKKLTELAGISKNNIGNYKNGQIPNANILYRISQILGTTMEYLLTGKEAGELTAEEQKLVDCYRLADDRGKRAIMRTAEQECTELESSDSRIG